MKAILVERSLGTELREPIKSTIELLLGAAAYTVLTLMAMAEPLVAMISGELSFGCFFVAVLFGFVLHAPFQHRWVVLAVAIALAFGYSLYRVAMQRLARFVGCREF